MTADNIGSILFWNSGATELYGWNAKQTLGRSSHDLLKTVFPQPLASIYAELHRSGRWEGDLIHTRSDDSTITVASRWTLQRDDWGAPIAVMEISRDITAQKCAEISLRDVHDRLSLALRGGRIGTWTWDIVKDVMICDDHVPILFGLRPGDAIADIEHFASLVHPDDREYVQARVADGLATGSYESEFRIPWPNGAVRFLAAHGETTFDGGKPVKMTGVCWDITDRKAADTAQPFQLVVEAAPNAMIMVAADGLITLVNTQTEKLFGYDRRELLGQSIDMLLPERFRPNHGGHRQAFFAAPATRSMGAGRDLFGVRRDGSEVPVEIGLNPIGTADGQFVLASIIDITERRQQEEEIRAKEANFRFLAESVPQIVWTARPDGWFDYYNQKWFEYTGTTLEQTEGWAWESVVHPDDRQNRIRAWTHAFETGEDYQGEYRFKRASDGAYRWHLGRALPLRDNQGRILKWFGTCTDIHDYKEAEARNISLREELEDRVRLRTADLETANEHLKSSANKLEQSNRELQDFASVASHDLQEPLRKVQAFGGRLKTLCAGTLQEQGEDYLNRMLNAVSRMQSLVQDLLTFSRVASPAPFVTVDLAAVTREVLSDLEVRIAETGAMVDVGDLPAIEADPLQMRQLLQNLIGNGLKFHKKGQPPAIRVRTEEGGSGLLRLLVEDDGIGFDEKYLDRIFTVFQRLHGRSEYEGTGVGLAICRKIAERHGGGITASSTPDHGAVFMVVLPRMHVPGDGALDERPD